MGKTSSGKKNSSQTKTNLTENYSQADVNVSAEYDETQIIKVWDVYAISKGLKYYYYDSEEDTVTNLQTVCHGTDKMTPKNAVILLNNDGTLFQTPSDDFITHTSTISFCSVVDNQANDEAEDSYNAITSNLTIAFQQIIKWNENNSVKIKSHTIQFPYHITDDHWGLGLMFLTFNDHLQLVNARIKIINPLPFCGGTKINNKNVIQNMQQALSDSFDKNVIMQNLDGPNKRQQNDGRSCGVITAENGKDIIDGTAVRLNVEYESGAINLRLNHLKDVKNYRFYQNQKENREYIVVEKLPTNKKEITTFIFTFIDKLIDKNKKKNYRDVLSKIAGLSNIDNASACGELRDIMVQDKESLLEIFDIFFNNDEGEYTAHGIDLIAYIAHQYVLNQLPDQPIAKARVSVFDSKVSNKSSSYDALISVEKIIAALPEAERPKTYLMSHLLAAGFRGTEYQLLVLLSQLIKLMTEKKHFEAVVEINNTGNLDDVGLVVFDNQTQVNSSAKTLNLQNIDAFQVKYYNHPISIYDFFNSPTEKPNKKSKEDEKMHIGKFFDGWIAWRERYPELPENKLCSIVYSNAGVDEILGECITNGNFGREFINKTKLVAINKKKSIKGKVPKKFLTKLKIKNEEVNEKVSNKIWAVLQENGILDEKGFITDAFKPKEKGFKLALPKDILPEGLTDKHVIDRLKQLHDLYVNNQTNVYDLLYEQTWSYLKAHKLHKIFTKKLEEEKQDLFRRFLASFSFKLNQMKLIELENDILQNLTKINCTPPGLVFLCLFQAIRDWFRRENYENKSVPKLTHIVMENLINQSLVHTKYIHRLQGRSQAVLANIHYSCAGKNVARSELAELQQILHKAETIIVVGEKGMGKSALMKQALVNKHTDEYIVLSAVDLIDDVELTNELIAISNTIESIRIIAIDGAEWLLKFKAEKLSELLKSLKKYNRTLVLTITPEAYRSLFAASKNTIIQVKPLLIENVLESCSELTKYQKLVPLMQLASKPFYLANIMQLIERIGPQEFNNKLCTAHIALDIELIKMIIEGQESASIEIRKSACRQLVYKLVNSVNGLSHGVKLTDDLGLQKLVQDNIVRHHKGLYQFGHDLFFESSLIIYLTEQWQSNNEKGKTIKFWKKLPKLLNFYGSDRVIEKWFTLYSGRITSDIIKNLSEISKFSYYKSFLVMAIVNHNNVLLENILKNTRLPLNKVLRNVAGYNVCTYVLLAIWSDNPIGLQLLLDHGASVHHPLSKQFKLENIQPVITQSTKKSTSSSQEDDSDDENNSDDEENSDNSKESSHSSSEESESSEYSDNSNRSDNGEDAQPYNDEEDLMSSLIEQFISDRNKYWSAGFDEEPGFRDDEGEWIENRKYEKPPTYHNSYLYQCILNKSDNCLSVLLQTYKKQNQQSTINAVNEYKETALHLCALKGSIGCAKILLDFDVALDSADHWGETPLHNAAYTDNVEIVKLLLARGADPNAVNEQGLSPLHIAIIRLNIDMVSVFLEYGGDLSLPPFASLIEGMHNADLLDRLYDNNRELHDTIEEFVLEIIELLNYGWDDNNFKWASKISKPDLTLRQKQLDQVEEFMTMAGSHVQLSENFPGFDYYDEESELKYAIENGAIEHLDYLQDYILSDPENIDDVFDSEAFSFIKTELLDHWFEVASDEQYKNLKRYGKKYKDEEVLKRIKEDQEILGVDSSENSSDSDSPESIDFNKMSISQPESLQVLPTNKSTIKNYVPAPVKNWPLSKRHDLLSELEQNNLSQSIAYIHNLLDKYRTRQNVDSEYIKLFEKDLSSIDYLAVQNKWTIINYHKDKLEEYLLQPELPIKKIVKNVGTTVRPK